MVGELLRLAAKKVFFFFIYYLYIYFIFINIRSQSVVLDSEKENMRALFGTRGTHLRESL